MKRRHWLRWGCAQCAAFGGLAAAQEPEWVMPSRFTRPDVAGEEGGLWALMDREETRLRRSPFRLRDDGLNAYLTGIACKLAAEHCVDIRVYPIRTPYFNASMAPNGMMQIWSGLLLRVENEAQLAGVIGHELGHFLQRHSVERLRDIKARAAFGTFISMFGLVGLVGQLAAIAGALAFSREHEREADKISIQLMQKTDYDPREVAKVWANLLDELKANPDADPTKNSVLFATHPPSDERRAALDEMAKGSSGQTFEREFQAQLAPFRFDLLDDELRRGRLNESVVLLDRLVARAPGDALLLHFRGEARRRRAADGDAALAFTDFVAALQTGQAPAVTHRSLGYLHKANGHLDAAGAAWRQYLERAPAAPDAALIKQSLQELNS